jgi:serine/threonine-protein kinase
MSALAPDRNLLFGLLALQNGLINQGQLVAAFQAWTLDKARALADHLVGRGDLDADDRSVVDALVAHHLKKYGGDAAKSLAALPTGRSTRAKLAGLGDPQIDASLAHVGPASTQHGEDAERTATYAVGEATSDGQRFRVLRPHARGGLGAVFVALDTELHREVALKQILDSHADDENSRHRFLVEAEVTGGLEHPGIVPVYGLGTYGDGRPYYAMRFIRGDSLKEAIDRFHADETLRRDPGRRSLELRRLLRRFTDVCNAIDYAHSRGVLHRDIKPGNIIVGRHGETLVVDWGLAKATGRSEPGAEERTLIPSSASGSADTSPGSALGTPAYMSPEQARGDVEHLGPRSDVYSLGATLYCLLTGGPPQEEDDVGELLRRVQRGEFPRPRRLDASVDPALEAICLKAMALDPEDRYASPRRLVADIERWMADEPVTAWAEPWTRTLSRWLSRHRTGMTGGAAALLAGVVGLLVVLAVQAQANGRLKRANDDLAIANGRVTKANADLKTANEREKQRFNLAMEAIKLFHGQVGDDLVLKADPFKPLRDRLLRGAAEFYGKLEGLLKDQPDRASRGAMGNAYFELGELTATIGDKPEALAAHRKGLDVRRTLASEAADDPQARVDVAKSLAAAAALLDATGDPAGALARYEEARDLLEGLPPSGSGSDDRRALLAQVYRQIGLVLAATGKAAEAMSAHRRSLEIVTRLADASPTAVPFQGLLALAHTGIGGLQLDTGKRAESIQSYRRAMLIRQKLVRENPAVAQFQSDLASSHNTIGILHWQAGEFAQALESYRQALAIREKLANDNPAITEFQRDLARTHFNIGIASSHSGRPSEAVASYRRALAIFRKLADENPAVTDFQSSVGRCYNNIGEAQSVIGEFAGALESYRRALEIKQKLADDHPAVTQFQGDLGRAQASIGGLELRAGRPAEALESLRRAAAIQRKLADDNPTVTQFRFDLAFSQFNLGGVQAETGQLAEALATYRLAVATLRKLADDNPAVSQYRIWLARTYANLAHVLRDLGRSAEARDSYERAVAIDQKLLDDNPDVPTYRSALASNLRQLGLLRPPAEAVADARRAAALYEGLPSRSGREWYELACCHAALAGAAGREASGIPAGDGEAEARKAMELLHRAVAEGYRDAKAIRGEASLDPLRSRPDFQPLMMDLAMPTEPFARPQ